MLDNELIFKNSTRPCVKNALQYIKGLFQTQTGKRNIERINEVIPGSNYENAQHFISDSKWDFRPVMNKVSKEASELFINHKLVGLLIDESGNEKKGEHSVGVGRQYCGQIGKVENCQVAVYAALSVNPYYALRDTELYLPKEWTDDPARCKKVGVPKGRRVHKTKGELALEVIERQVALGTRFDWIGGDGFYGNDYHLAKRLDELGQVFVFEVHSNQQIYTEKPIISVPERKSSKGRSPSRLSTDITPIEVRELGITLSGQQWQQMKIRKSSTGFIEAQVWIQKVYVWDHKESKAREHQLIIRKTLSGEGQELIKYALTNASRGQFSDLELVQMQSERYFIERAFQDAKQQVGMCEYQIRGWLAWNHHMALVMISMMFILREKIIFSVEKPLLSAYDVRQIMIETYSRKATTVEEIDKQIQYRHKQRLASQKTYSQ